MKKTNITNFILPIFLILAFIIFTFLVTKIDVHPAGPKNSKIGFTTFNIAVHNLVGINLLWYKITDWLGLVPVFFAFTLTILGFIQMIKQRSVFKVDKKLLLMGIFYILLIGLYLFFEKWIINFRPVLVEEMLEASYPSSHTMIAISILGTGIYFIKDYIKSKKIYMCISTFLMV